jgi:predicted NACHT family NTPase
LKQLHIIKDEKEDDKNRVPVGERPAKSSRMVLLGDPGAGKTTLIRWIATAYLLRLKQDPAYKDLPDVATLPGKDWLPIVIRCRKIGTVHPSVRMLSCCRIAEFFS